MIFEESIQTHGQIHDKKAKEAEVAVDATVQEKNITSPTDLKLLRKIIKKCREIAKEANITLRRSFRRELPSLLRQRMKSKKIVKQVRLGQNHGRGAHS